MLTTQIPVFTRIARFVSDYDGQTVTRFVPQITRDAVPAGNPHGARVWTALDTCDTAELAAACLAQVSDVLARSTAVTREADAEILTVHAA